MGKKKDEGMTKNLEGHELWVDDSVLEEVSTSVNEEPSEKNEQAKKDEQFP